MKQCHLSKAIASCCSVVWH